MPQTMPEPEFHRPIPVGHIPTTGFQTKIDATEGERTALARRFSLVALKRFSAAVTIRPIRGGQMFRVEGHLDADVVQTCVVTLEPVEARISEPFGAAFAEPQLIKAPGADLVLDIDADEEDDPEPIESGSIDIGEVASQHLGLALDPYPRKPGVSFDGVSIGDGDQGGDAPFGQLSSLMRRS